MSDLDETSPAAYLHTPGTAVRDVTSAVTDPGLPEHSPRRTDLDPQAARRAERQVAGLFLLSVLATIGFIVAYVAIPANATIWLPVLQKVSAVHIALGGTVGVALLSIGLAAVHWAKTLMPSEEVIQQRHPLSSEPQERTEATQRLLAGGEQSGLARRSLIRRSMLTALAALVAPPIILLKELGPAPHKTLDTTPWKGGMRLLSDPDGRPIKPEDVRLGGVVHVLPDVNNQGFSGLDLAAQSQAAVLLIRMNPEDIKSQQGPGWDYQGLVAFSKVCTHVGCPVGLYEQTTHHLLCPCHQSTFDVANGAQVVFGPAGHPLPQLAITIDTEGYLVARQGFTQPVGPSFWERS